MSYDTIIINSPLFHEPKSYDTDEYLPPIGLGYITSYLLSKDISTYLLDSIGDKLSFNEIINEVNKIKPKFIGINIFSTNLSIVKELIESIKFDVHFIIGGISTKALYSEIFTWETNNQIDVVYGDGEVITYHIITNSLDEEPKDNRINRRYFIVDKNSKYFNHDISNLPLNRYIFHNEPIINALDEKEISIVASRGCIFNCAYCSASAKQNKTLTVRERSTESLKNELELITNMYNDVKTIRVLDDLFLKNEKSLLKAIDIFNSFDYTWRGMAHINSIKNISIEIFEELKKSGCFELSIGIESGSKKIIKMIKKNTKVDTVISTIDKLFQAGISVKGYFILGFPDETLADFQETYDLAETLKENSKKHNVDFRISVFQFRPYHGTDLYERIYTGEKVFIKKNEDLSSSIGRDDFNFSAGNFSSENTPLLNEYISKIHNLN